MHIFQKEYRKLKINKKKFKLMRQLIKINPTQIINLIEYFEAKKPKMAD